MRFGTAKDPRDPRLNKTLGKQLGLVNAVAFSWSGSQAIAGGGDGSVQVWDLAAGARRHSFQIRQAIKEVYFSHDDRLAIALPYEDGRPLFWDLANGQPVRDPVPGGDLFSSLYASSYDRSIRGYIPFVVADDSCECWVIRVLHEPGKVPRRRLIGHTGYPRALPMLSDDARWLISGGADRTVRVWDVVNEKQCLELIGHDNDVTCVAFSPRGQNGYSGLSGGKDGQVRLWESIVS